MSIYNIDINDPVIPDNCYPRISFLKEEDYIFVESIFDPCNLSESELVWQNIKITGSGKLPDGSIKQGDVISDCSGEVRLIWIPEDIVIFEEYF